MHCALILEPTAHAGTSARIEPEAEITFIENRQVSVTAEKVAINTVMAGCKPEYMPVVVAAVEALGDPRWGYHGPATSTGGSAVFNRTGFFGAASVTAVCWPAVAGRLRNMPNIATTPLRSGASGKRGHRPFQARFAYRT